MKMLLSVMLLILTNNIISAKDFANDICDSGNPKECITACNNGNLKACDEVGRMYAFGGSMFVIEDKLKQDTSKAQAYWKKACDGGYSHGCYTLAETYGKGFYGIKLDSSKSKQYYLKARECFLRDCDRGDMAGCYTLGEYYEHAYNMEKNYSKAKYYYSKACDGEFFVGCESLAVMYANGIGMEKNFSKGMEILKKSCRMGSVSACQTVKRVETKGL